MTLFEKIVWYRNRYGLRGLLLKGIRVLAGERKARVRDPSIVALESKALIPSSEQLLAVRFFRQRPLRAYPTQRRAREVVLVMDSISRGSLFGGVATSILVAAVVARKAGIGLKILCRQERANEREIPAILALNDIEFTNRISFGFLSTSNNLEETDIGVDDVIITTSWWTTESVVRGLGERDVFHLLQEDERMFYPFDDDHLRCSTLLANQSIRLIINTELLYSHFQASRIPGLQKRAVWFEPAFRHAVEELPPARLQGKRNFFFYARPNHPRNLFYLGLEVIQACVQRGVLDPDQWNFSFVGSAVPELTIGDGTPVKRYENLAWADYVDLIMGVDVGLSLMYTPHPSYPPLDLAAAGAVAVTNTMGVKTSLDRYCRNIICAEPEVEALVQAVRVAVELSGDREQRANNLRDSAFQRDWSGCLEPVAEFVLRG